MTSIVIDHLVYGVPDLDAGVAELTERLGVEAAYGGSHRGRGTHNALLALGGTTYLEVIAPDPAQAADDHPDGLPFGVHAAITPHLVGWAVTVADVDAAVARAREGGDDPGDAAPMQRETADGTLLEWRLTPSRYPLPFLIDWGGSPHPSATAPAGATLEQLTLEHPRPDEAARSLRALGAGGLVELTSGPQIALIAHISGSKGRVAL